MTKNQIISDLYLSKEVEEFLLKIQPSYLREDLKQYAFAVLCEKKDSFIIDLSRKNQLKFFLVKIITNSIFSNNSGFLKQHKIKDTELTDDYDLKDYSDEYHEMIQKCVDQAKKIYWYNQELLKLYAEHGTYRKVSVITNIPVKSVHNAIKKAKTQIKNEIWKM
jgi:DNA-directed RNA polymerase specialized sigma24 family protein